MDCLTANVNRYTDYCARENERQREREIENERERTRERKSGKWKDASDKQNREDATHLIFTDK